MTRLLSPCQWLYVILKCTWFPVTAGGSLFGSRCTHKGQAPDPGGPCLLPIASGSEQNLLVLTSSWSGLGKRLLKSRPGLTGAFDAGHSPVGDPSSRRHLQPLVLP
jgi:hypothetical protein